MSIRIYISNSFSFVFKINNKEKEEVNKRSFKGT